jgi:ribose-phosphate pyrophosphokinase
MSKPAANRELMLLAGNSNPALASEIAASLDIPLTQMRIGAFSDGEVQVKIDESVRGADCFLIQSTCAPVNQNLMELLIMIDAAKRSSAWRITPVIPYFGYARQDRKDRPRVPITAKLVANLITAAGADRILTVDLHADQIQGFFDIPVDHLYAMPVLIDHLMRFAHANAVVVSPDAGGVERARGFARRLEGLPLAIVDKRRPSPNVAEIHHVIGEVEGKDAIIVDDMVDTAGTLLLVANAIKAAGAASVRAVASHPVFSGAARERIENSILEEMIVTNSIPVAGLPSPTKITQLSVAPLLGEAIKRIHCMESVSSLFL